MAATLRALFFGVDPLLDVRPRARAVSVVAALAMRLRGVLRHGQTPARVTPETEGAMRAYGWERWSPVAGLLYVVLFVIALVTTPDTGETNREILEHYADEGNRRNDIILTALLAAAALAFVWFASHLRSLLAAAAPRSALPTLALGAGVASAGLLLVAAATFGSISFTYEEGDFELDPNTARLVGSIGYGVFVGSMWMAGLVVLATSLVALRTRLLPTWLAWLGFVVALALVFAFAFVPVFALLAWVALVSIVLLSRLRSLGLPAD